LVFKDSENHDYLPVFFSHKGAKREVLIEKYIGTSNFNGTLKA